MNAGGLQLLLAAVLIGLLAMRVSPTSAAEYVLSPDGDDAAAGDAHQPWRTLQKANTTLESGDTAVFLPGEYVGSIAPERSGTADAPITYRSSEPRGARLIADGAQDVIRLSNREHITVEGFHVDGGMQARWIQADSCHHITVRGCAMRNTPRPVSITNSTQLRLLDNLFSQDRSGPTDMMWIEECSEVLVEGNSFTRAGHSPFTLNYVNNVVIRANVFHGEWGRDYITYSLGRCLWEGNIITRARDSGGSAEAKAHSFWDHGIFRHNLVFDNLGTPLNIGSYIWQGVSHTGRFRAPFNTRDSRFYHNTFTDNLGPAWYLGGIDVSANVFQNNIFHRNDWAGGHEQITRTADISRDNRFVANLFRGDEPGQAVLHWGDEYWTAEEANKRTPTTGGFWSQAHLNIDADPSFVDAQNRDYRLQADSGAIDAGDFLARAVGSGTGTALPVNDGVPFYDGFGIEGEEGDIIAIGTGDNLAQVLKVELRYNRPAILHLDREVTWTDAMPVSLPWAGAAPDIGAYEHGVTDPTRFVALARPSLIEPGQSVSFSLDALGKELASVTWDFGDGSVSDEPAPTHTFTQAGHYGVTVRAKFTNGRRRAEALFVKVEQPVDPSAPLLQGDFETATMDTHWGYQFKFYRGHQTGAANVERRDGEGLCMHLFYDPKKANQTAAQVAPGAWDIDQYPLVRFEYRIPTGVPVAVQLSPFDVPGRPSGLILAGTANQESRFGELEGYTLVDDGGWHEITMDVRRLRTAYPGLKYLRQFMFSTPWRTPPPPARWTRFPALQARCTSHPDGPEDTGRLDSLDTLLLRAREPGAWVQMPFSLRAETSGEVLVDLVNHTDRGAIRILLDGKVAVERYEHYSAETTRQSVSLGTMTLAAGEHTLRIEVFEDKVGFVGLGGLSIRPEGAPTTPALTPEQFEFWFDNFAILPE
ncbi:MAG TPA: hypothetical protein DGT21_20415 [Armatimonadetes bacterium]|jgi:hypothetical protein|nr:hypothetical protein [Armatimonadota bacterium]